MPALWLNLLALVVAATGAALLYLGSPRQLVLARPLPARAGLGWGLTLLLAAWLLWCVPWHPAAAFFATLTVTMAWLVALPVGASLLKRKGTA